MTEIRLFLPENNGCPVLMEHEELYEDEGTIVNLKFDNFEISYGAEKIKCSCCEDEGFDIPRLIVKDGLKEVFNMDFNKHWLLNLEIKNLQAPIKNKNKLYEISFWITNMDDGDMCEICENNRFYFNHKSVVNNYSMYYYSPPKGPFMEHPPDPKEQLDDTVLEGLK